MKQTHIILGVSASISAYKAADLTNELTKRGYAVDVLMTKNATKFITPLTLQSLSKRPVHIDVMAENQPDQINHIDLAKQASLFLVAPATANTIGKLANGIADDMVSTVALAIRPGTPRLIAPAMNTYMYENPINQKNLAYLKEVGYKEVVPREAMLACGDFGRGALATIEDIIKDVEAALAQAPKSPQTPEK
ncbi:phosphopantothenoylcysteine decarboxylase [Enterococcus diestrammenae]|uniref:Phosphopantothenoylcysteine decarboxylase n=1 Tax=Enterococcus diestrammenae TaxID=1155073 RepID=A0ABV0F3Y0_9ENTE|nr:phosphopantothenoylcysteine decarboxylase [Enterococcus diestrammenae]KAF1297013.1 phosphopantothenoylcysteine decarboxylase [Enterococcus diestrammenae]